MRAMVYTAPSTVELLDVDAPSAGHGEVVVDVAVAGICGSELHGIQQPGFRVPPLVMGHEFAGVASDGRRVVVNPLVACRSCDLCSRGSTELCRNREIVGIHRAGAFAESVVVPESSVHELPSSVAWTAAALVEPLANAIHSWRLASPGTSDRIAVVGAGSVGLVSLIVARHFGARDVFVADVASERTRVAQRLGADRVASSLDGEFDVVFDAVGVPATRHASVAHLRPGGTAVWIGLMGADPAFDSLDLIRMEKTVRGSFCYTDDEFRDAVELAGTVDTSWVEEFPLEDGVRIFNELMHGRADVVKALLRP